MVDDPDARSGADAAHLEGCPECQAQLKAAGEDARSIASLLAVSEARVDAGRAFQRVANARYAKPALVRFPILRPAPRSFTLAFVAAVAAGARARSALTLPPPLY